LGTSEEAFGNSGEQIGKKGVKKQKIPPTPSGKGKEQAHHKDMPSLPIGCRKFLFPKLSVSIIFLGFVLVMELISSQFLHLFLFRFVSFGCLFLKGAWETNYSQPPNLPVCPNLHVCPKESNTNALVSSFSKSLTICYVVP